MMKKANIIFLLVLGFLLLPQVSLAADSRCFTFDDCARVRQTQLGLPEAEAKKNALYQGVDAKNACGKVDEDGNQVGFCYPVTQIETKTRFGDLTEFANIGEFIQVMYRYAVIAAGIVAVIIILVAGLQWTVSGGNPEQINSARKRIAGALMGLLLAAGSYLIIGTINPYLVNLRLPQAWLINTMQIESRYCSDIASNVGLVMTRATRIGKTEQQIATLVKSKKGTAKFNIPGKEAKCGDLHFAAENSDNVCIGLACPEGETCVAVDGTPSICKSAVLSGRVTAEKGILCEGDLQKSVIIDNDLELIALCKNGKVEEITEIDVPGVTKEMVYTFDGGLIGRIGSACKSGVGGGAKNVLGFFLGAEVNDESTGFFCPGSPLTAAYDDWHAIGKTTKTSNTCTVNLGKLAYSLVEGGQPPSCKGDDGLENCSCAAITYKPNSKSPSRIQRIKENPAFVDHLITYEELEKGFRCDIHINRAEFPRLDQDNFSDDDSDCFEYN